MPKPKAITRAAALLSGRRVRVDAIGNIHALPSDPDQTMPSPGDYVLVGGDEAADTAKACERADARTRLEKEYHAKRKPVKKAARKVGRR